MIPLDRRSESKLTRSQHPQQRSSTANRVEVPKVGTIVDFDAAKKVTGRKRHIAVDTLGLLLVVVVHAASVQDQVGARDVLTGTREKYRRLKVVFGDSAYGRSGLPAWFYDHCQVILQTVLRPVGAKGFVILPKRWIVERTFAWMNLHRRPSKDYEKLPENSEAVLHIAMIDLMSKRLART